jgi:hypothetical protein
VTDAEVNGMEDEVSYRHQIGSLDKVISITRKNTEEFEAMDILKENKLFHSSTKII